MSRSTRDNRPAPISDRKKLMTFGRYKGESISDILECDPGYLAFLHHNNAVFELDADLLEEAESGAKPEINSYLRT